MTSYAELAAALPIDQIAAQVGEDPDAVRRAVDVALPALFGGLEANTQDAGGAASLLSALDQHDGELASGTIDASQVDTADGAAITRHVFGDQTDQVVSRLGASEGVESGLVKKLLPILAPIVLSYLAKQMGGKDSGALGSVLSTIIAGALQGTGQTSSGSGASAAGKGVGSILGDLLGGLLGFGRKA